MPPQPYFINDKFELLVRKCIVFPADGSDTRLVHMVVRTVTVEDINTSLTVYNRCVDMASTFGEEYCKTQVAATQLSTSGGWDSGDEFEGTRDDRQSTYLFFYNLSLNLPINLNLASVVRVTPSQIMHRKRLFWRGDVVAMKVERGSSMGVVDSLDANPSDLDLLTKSLRQSFQDGFLEQGLEAREQQWKTHISQFEYCGPTSLFSAPATYYWGRNAASLRREEFTLRHLNQLRCIVGHPPLPRHIYMKSYTELFFTLFAAFKSALRLPVRPKVTETGPKLPLELERRIFEMCALDSPEICVTLMLVARRVHVWIDPILIETVCMTDLDLEPFLAKLNNGKPVEYYAKHVKNLSIATPTSSGASENTVVKEILAICTGVENLRLWADLDFFGNPHSGSNLRRLTMRLARCWSSPNFYHPCFANLTHLHICDYQNEWDTYVGWESLSSLTHLAFASSGPPGTILSVIQTMPAVRYVAIGQYHKGRRYGCVTVNHYPFVRAAWGSRTIFLEYIPDRDWEWGARGEGDFWDIVEQEVERRLEEEGSRSVG